MTQIQPPPEPVTKESGAFDAINREIWQSNYLVWGRVQQLFEIDVDLTSVVADISAIETDLETINHTSITIQGGTTDEYYHLTEAQHTGLTGGGNADSFHTHSHSSEKTWAFTSPAGSSGTFYFDGYYLFASSNNDFSPSTTLGSANNPYSAHFMIVLGEITVDELTIRVSGTTIDDNGTRTASNTADIVIPNATAANSYFETPEKWIGQVSIEAVSGTAKNCNYGFCKYWDNQNSDFTVTGLETTWLAGANDTGADIRLLHHKATGWTYNAGAEPTPPTAIAAMATDLVTEKNLVNGQEGAWKRTNLSTDIEGSGSEGIIWQFITSANKAFELGNAILRIQT